MSWYLQYTVWSNMIVIKVFSYKTLKIEFKGSIFDLNSTQVWAIMCKSAIIKINSLFHQNLGTINECSNWREPQTKHLLSITILKIGPCLVRFLLMLYSWAVSRNSKCGQFRFFEFVSLKIWHTNHFTHSVTSENANYFKLLWFVTLLRGNWIWV